MIVTRGGLHVKRGAGPEANGATLCGMATSEGDDDDDDGIGIGIDIGSGSGSGSGHKDDRAHKQRSAGMPEAGMRNRNERERQEDNKTRDKSRDIHCILDIVDVGCGTDWQSVAVESVCFWAGAICGRLVPRRLPRLGKRSPEPPRDLTSCLA